ncbi:hypothetical protein, variant 1 [Aphanomyces invadans]|uniref:ATP-dependent DNA helicase n=1 Tax=Aphanomyces invadans TaxID=157072 RepID=A0A024UFB1_9STRA|nr:hypothetical protein, variant 1 [Aphanomyces invadans]ETW04323.1 hypothetical protein, variant 1 [Aphanomyces invadans]|eukprot:XP_008867279.1 hypothetical protein, variant 1 [Aphanomyces invadans]
MSEGIRCDVEIQVALTATGQNSRTKLIRNARLCQRKGGLQLFGEHYKTAIRTHGVELYFSHVLRGKLTFIWRETLRYTQYNCHNGAPNEMLQLKEFALTQGAIAKSPLPILPTASSVTRPPLQDRTNVATTLVPVSPPSKRRQRTSPAKARQHASQYLTAIPKRNRVLTPQQAQVVAAIQRNENVFFTGRAGTGKSFLLGHIQRVVPPTGLYLTATTGIAAFHIHGMTLHHFAGLTAMDKLHVPTMLATIQRNKDALFRWTHARTLVVDEISMLDGRMFEALEAIARQLRQSTRFFGGIQLIVSGDFYQLPPVAQDRQPRFCFEVAAWQRGMTISICLDQVFRQRDADFVDILNAIRVGTHTSAMLAKLNQRMGLPTADAIHIFSHNEDVFAMNEARLTALQGKAHEYAAIDTGDRELLKGSPISARIQLKSTVPPRVIECDGYDQRYPVNCMIECLCLRRLWMVEGVIVMLTKSLSVVNGLVNGARGTVLGFTRDTHMPIVRFDHGISQPMVPETFPIMANHTVVALPLTLAYAISIHKSQGLTFDRAVLHLGKVFEYGQAYVALSRLSSLRGLTLATPVTHSTIRVHPRVRDGMTS